MARKLNWGILTTGSIARKFATDLPQSQSGRLVAVAARRLADAVKFSSDFGGIAPHGSYERLLADPAVEAVYIGTPHPWHAEWAIKAAQAGKQVLCEKPLTMNAADTERVIAAAKQHRVLLMEAYMYRFHPQTRKVVELVRGGAIGELRLIRASFNVVMKFDPQHRMFNKALGGSTILDLGGYPMSYARHIAGAAHGRDFIEPEEFQGIGHLHPVSGADDFATAAARFPGDVRAELSCGATHHSDNSVQIHGTAGWIDVPNPFVPGLLGREEKIVLHRRDGQAEEIVIRSTGKGLYAYEADAVAEALGRGELEVPLGTWADTLGTARLLDRWLAAAGVKFD
ncbi:MAG TPA: Gfo/Idh/MocA family oxidoreductase [Lacunisphaera sp.]|nr:Gfo/Idh/MocA family oxidoreductase [Lacunisphaera sp.]